MCVIIHLAPNAMIDKTHLYNAVYNNWHGYGLILRDKSAKKLQVIKKYNDKGNDPEEIFDLLEDNKDIERFLHVRYSTRGAEGDLNTQPFPVYNSDKREVYFMHNGTLGSFGTYGQTGKSDTHEFCEKILQPALLRWEGEYGRGDYNDPEFYRLVVDKQWVANSKGLFVSNDLDPKRIGVGWSLYKQEDAKAPDIWVSNTEYFASVTRGPEKVRRDEVDRQKREEARKNDAPFQGSHTGSTSNTNTSGTDNRGIKQWDKDALLKSPSVLKAVNDIIDTWSLDDPKDVAKLKYVAYDEWYDLLASEGEYYGAAFIQKLAEMISTLAIRNMFLEKTKAKAQAHIATLMTEKKSKENTVEQKAA